MSDKQDLIAGLKKQAELMTSNSILMRDIYGSDSNASELSGAAQITLDWISEITKEIRNSTF